MAERSKKHRSFETPPNPFSDGMFVVVNKPYRWTSFDVVNKFRYLLTKRLGVRRIKVGHAGTLDPLATGVVVLCTGKYTKRIEEVQAMEKVYYATIRLGETTPSFDLESEVDGNYAIDHITKEDVERVLRSFEGEIEQVPPTFSAVKVDGKRSYELARKGEEVTLQAKTIKISSMELLKYAMPDIKIKVTCGKGTYIRALARDIGLALNSGGHLTELCRSRVGAFEIEDAIGVEGFERYIDEKLNNKEEDV